jgi:hypothetical protein
MLQQFMQLVQQTIMPHEAVQSTTSEDTDMGMTPEEQAKLDQLSQTVETLAASLADLVKTQNTAIESEDTPAEEAPDTPPALTLDDLNASIANAVAPLMEKITALENAPAPSAKLREDTPATEPQKESTASLPWDHPDRIAARGKK